jgi:poly-gamma-glutamate synthesis protein (capsule biosynthesis protein)
VSKGSQGLWLALALLALTFGLQIQLSGAGEDPAPDLSVYPWLYLRDGRPLAANETLVEVILAGDVMLGRGVVAEAEPFADTAVWLAAADVAVGNLESPISQTSPPRLSASDGRQPYQLSAPVSAANHLGQASFDLLGLANNHSLDNGPAGLAETAASLQQAGMTAMGAAPGDEAYRPVIREVNGVRLAFLAVNAVPDPGQAEAGGWARAEWDEARLTAAITAARRQADAVIVSVHWGYEYQLRPDPWQEGAAATLLAAGADVVAGHHPHVAQPVRVDFAGGRVVAHSLGNFVFDQVQAESDKGLVLRVFFDEEGLRAVQLLPIWAGLRPRLMTPAEAEPLLARVLPPPPRIGFACMADSCAPAEVSNETDTAAVFWSGAIDLTGDGAAELVRRAGERVTIYRQGATVWQSPAEWRVVDLALGDPNDDGRAEMILAIYRPDPDGYERSQPYLVGYRGGEYKVMWGGRPLVFPILEVELGDVDGDGAQELVVLEDQGEAQTIAVWRWQGWSFSLVWRSPPGRYRDLLLSPGADGRLMLTVHEHYPGGE